MKPAFILAKSSKSPESPQFEETLIGHTLQVMRSFQIMFGTDSPTRLGSEWMRFFKLGDSCFPLFVVNGLAACGLHDIGKANNGFQNMVRRKPAIQVIRHEHLSGLQIGLPDMQDWLKQIAGIDIGILFSAVAGHHLRSAEKEFAQPHEDLKIIQIYPGPIRKILACMGEIVKAPAEHGGFDTPELWSFDGSAPFDAGGMRDELRQKLARFRRELKKNPASNRLLMAVRAALVLADSCGSAIFRESKELKSWLGTAFGDILDSEDIEKSVIEPRTKQIEMEKGRFEWSSFQDASEALPPRALLLSPCGSGKTLAAWRWIKGQLAKKPAARVIFLYPTRATATEGFRDYVSWAPETDASLIHGTAAYELDGMFEQAEDERSKKDFSTEDRLYALAFWHRRIFSATVDQFLGFMQQSYRSVCLLPLLADSVVVFDEVHSFDKSLFSALKLFLKNFDIPVLCMTASLPSMRMEELTCDCGLTPFPTEQNRFDDLEKMARMPRYEVVCIENQDEAEDIAVKEFDAGNRVLWVVNTVSRCQHLAKKLDALCYHSRFRLEDRKQHHEAVIGSFHEGGSPVLAITTQVCEMSLNLDADVLISEMAPIPSMIQRMGRCNRNARPEDNRLGRVFFYAPEDEKPYSVDELAGCEFFQKALDGKTVNQKELQELLEKFGPAEIEVDKFAAFLENGPWAASREQSLRDENSFTVNALLDTDISVFFKLRKEMKPADGLFVPVPKRFAKHYPNLGRFPLVAPSIHYRQKYGFFDNPQEEIL